MQKAIQTAGKALETAENVVAAAGTVAGVAADAATNVVAKAGSAVGAVSHLAGSAATPITSVAERRRAEAARLRALRSRARQPLPSLWEVHPDARRAALRELGTQTVPIDRIVGTAVAGPTQRGGDFLPLPRLRGSNWESRWQRIRKAVDRLEPLPPVDLLRFGDEYWIVDGHNRVAAANYAGQVAIDGSVVDLRLPGMARTTPALVGAQLAEQRAFRDGVRRALQGGDRRESSEASQE